MMPPPPFVFKKVDKPVVEGKGMKKGSSGDVGGGGGPGTRASSGMKDFEGREKKISEEKKQSEEKPVDAKPVDAVPILEAVPAPISRPPPPLPRTTHRPFADPISTSLPPPKSASPIPPTPIATSHKFAPPPPPVPPPSVVKDPPSIARPTIPPTPIATSYKANQNIFFKDEVPKKEVKKVELKSVVQTPITTARKEPSERKAFVPGSKVDTFKGGVERKPNFDPKAGTAQSKLARLEGSQREEQIKDSTKSTKEATSMNSDGTAAVEEDYEPTMLSSLYNFYPTTAPSNMPLPLTLTFSPYHLLAPQPTEQGRGVRYVRCVECMGFLNPYNFAENGGWSCVFCNNYMDLPFNYNSKGQRGGGGRGEMEDDYDYDADRTDLVEPNRRYLVTTNMRTVPTLPKTIHVFVSSPPPPGIIEPGHFIVVAGGNEINVVGGKQTISISDFDDVIMPCSIDQLKVIDTSKAQSTVERLVKERQPLKKVAEAVKFACFLTSIVGGADILLYTDSLPSAVSARELDEARSYLKKCNGWIQAVGGEKGYRGKRKGWSDVVCRVRVSRALHVTKIVGPCVDTSDSSLSATFIIPSSVPYPDYVEGNDPPAPPTHNPAAFHTPRLHPDDTFTVEVEYHKASFGTLARSLNGNLVAQVSVIYTDEAGRRWMNVCSRRWEAGKGEGEWLKGFRAESVIWTIMGMAMERGGVAEKGEEEKRKLVRRQAGEFFARYQSNADVCHITSSLPALCMAGEKCVLLKNDNEGREGKEWIEGGEGRLMKLLRPVFVCLSEIDGNGFLLEEGDDEKEGNWDPKVWCGRPKRDLFWPSCLTKLSLPLTRESMSPGYVYVISNGFQTFVLPTAGVADGELERLLESPCLESMKEVRRGEGGSDSHSKWQHM